MRTRAHGCKNALLWTECSYLIYTLQSISNSLANRLIIKQNALHSSRSRTRLRHPSPRIRLLAIPQIEPGPCPCRPRLPSSVSAIRQRIIRLLRALPVPRHPSRAGAASERRRSKRIRGPLVQGFVALDSVKFVFAAVPREVAAAARAAAGLVVATAARLLRADVVLLAVKSLQERLEALALVGDIVEAVGVVADVVGHEVSGGAAQVRSLRVLTAGAIEGACTAEGLVDEAVEVVGAAGSGHLEAAHETLSVRLASRAVGLRASGRETQNIDLGPFDAHLDILQPCRLRPVVALAYEVIDLALVVIKKRLNVLLVEKGGALRARQDQVEVGEEADPRVERHPAKDEVERVLDDGEGREDDEVDEPWRELGGVRGVQGLVRGEDGEQDSRCDAARGVS
jgi:hypothetical protein